MATVNLRVQLEFRMGADGWSELYWHAGTSPKSFALNAADLVTERKKCLVNDAVIHHVRISAAQPGAHSYRFPVPNGSGALPNSYLRDVGPVTTTVGVYSTSGSFRKLQLHGLPDTDHAYDDNGVPSVTLSGNVATFLAYLKAQSYQIRSVSAKAGDLANKKIADIAVAGTGVVTFTVDATGLVGGQKVRVSGARGSKAKQFNGVWTVGTTLTPITNGFTAVTNRIIDPNFFYVTNSAVIRNNAPESYQFFSIDDWDAYEYPGTRRTGRPTDSPRGRRSSQR